MRWRIVRGGPAKRFSFARSCEMNPPPAAALPENAQKSRALPFQKKIPPSPAALDNPYYRCYPRRGRP